MIDSVRAQDYALTVYGGRVTEETWMEAFSLNVDLVDAYILVAAMAWTLARTDDNALTLEIEGQVARYFGDQDHLEFNVPVAVRWCRFPWDNVLDTSIAFGLGPSWAAEDPEVELMTHDSTRQLLVYWFLEVALGPSGGNWATVFRLHHRSTGFGTVAEDGGSNTLAAGLKYRF